MQFISDGPHIPNEILEAQESGKLVFFCGAGISYPLGLKDFNGLVDDVRSKLALDQDDTLPKGIPKDEFYKDEATDKTIYRHPDLFLNYLAKHLDGINSNSKKGFIKVKQAIMESLKITKCNYKTHKAILNLSHNNGNYRIVTTNADHGFVEAARILKLKGLVFDSYPYLPPADTYHLKHPVHLHGLIDEKNDPNGDNLIFTSADFGNAYLINGRAAKFITELFSNEFIILFIGYSLSDPILRYMTDALAYSSHLTSQAFVLAPYGTENLKDQKTVEEQWKFKGITPILCSDENHHKQLHKTLTEWAKIQNELGKKGIINLHSHTDPKILRDNPDIQHKVDWVVWALRNKTGETAKYFSEIEPTPPIGWLQIFKDDDLLRTTIKFSTSCAFAYNHDTVNYPLNNIQDHLLPWIEKHLNEPQLFQIIIQSGNNLHPKLQSIIQAYLNKSKDKNTPLNRAWNLLLKLDPPEQAQMISDDNIDAGALLKGITPYVQITPFKNEQEKNRHEKFYNDPRKFANITVEIQPYCFESAYDQLVKDKKTLFGVAFKLTDILKNLYDKLALYDSSLCSESNRPSIGDHEYNQIMSYKQWPKLIGLVRDSWKEILQIDQQQALSLTNYWRSLPYTIFRRLVLYAMAESELYSSEKILDYLLEDEGKWLWDLEIKCERYELIEKKCQCFSKKQIYRLIKLAFDSYKINVRKNSYELFWFLRDIEQYKQRKFLLPRQAINFLEKNKLQGWQREEWKKRFFHGPCIGWVVGENSDLSSHELCHLETPVLYSKLTAEESIDKNEHIFNVLEEKLSAWLSGLKTYPQSGIDMAEFLLKKQLEDKDVKIWRTIFYGLNENKESWEVLSSAILRLPIDFSDSKNIYAVISWLKDTANLIEMEKSAIFLKIIHGVFLTLKKNVLAPNRDNNNDTDALHEAINSPIGSILNSLITLMSREVNKVGALIPEKFKKLFEKIIAYIGQKPSYPYAIFGLSLYYLFNIDKQWTTKNIINHMKPFEGTIKDLPLASSIWTGYLYSERISADLMEVLKLPLLHFVSIYHDAKLLTKKIPRELIAFFTYCCMYFPNILKHEDIQPILAKMRTDKLAIVAQTLMLYLKSSKDADLCWVEKIFPFVKNCWPQKEDLNTNSTTISFAQIILMLNDEQNTAFMQLKNYLKKLNNKDKISTELFYLYHNSNNAMMLLKILDWIIDENNLTSSLKLSLDRILTKLAKANQEIPKHSLFEKLKKLIS